MYPIHAEKPLRLMIKPRPDEAQKRSAAVEVRTRPRVRLTSVPKEGQRFGCLYVAPPIDGEEQPAFSTESLCNLPVGQLASGRSKEWLISHEELTRIRNEGLLPL